MNKLRIMGGVSRTHTTVCKHMQTHAHTTHHIDERHSNT